MEYYVFGGTFCIMSDQAQLGFLIEGFDPPAAKPQDVREELESVLEKVRAAKAAAPWDRETHKLYLVELTEKAKVLPPDEAEFMRRQLVFEFERIEILLAA